MSFENAYAITSEFEGGWSNDPKDPGGKTWRGIAYNKHCEWAGWVIIATYNLAGKSNIEIEAILSKDQKLNALVKDFYFNEFWKKCKCDVIDAFAPEIAEELYDSCVNTGPGNGIKFLQRALNYLNKGGTVYPDLKDDGGIGAGTLNAVKICCQNAQRRMILLKAMNGEQYKFYTSRPNVETYYGWLARC